MSLARARTLESRPVSGFFARASEVPAPPSAPTVVVDGARGVRIGGRLVDAGAYRVRLDETRERIVLENDDRTYAFTAFFRRARSSPRAPLEAFLEPNDGTNRRFLVVRLASGAEWVA